jgi:hypothetical protein
MKDSPKSLPRQIYSPRKSPIRVAKPETVKETINPDLKIPKSNSVENSNIPIPQISGEPQIDNLTIVNESTHKVTSSQPLELESFSDHSSLGDLYACHPRRTTQGKY